ncbi:hypothetical protein [Lysinibacillus sp. FSL M8-0355]
MTREEIEEDISVISKLTERLSRLHKEGSEKPFTADFHLVEFQKTMT